MDYKCSFHFVLVTVTPFKFRVPKTIYSINGQHNKKQLKTPKRGTDYTEEMKFKKKIYLKT